MAGRKKMFNSQELKKYLDSIFDKEKINFAMFADVVKCKSLIGFKNLKKPSKKANLRNLAHLMAGMINQIAAEYRTTSKAFLKEIDAHLDEVDDVD